ncbi:Uncharacterized protein BP5553_05292 [Venustampulla echinocandica]|uniref:Uncharacterized protein n=1 Tax=Venustampulla echinocandica TaxID=2656787 RepID=A0A370TQR0_9HELO|nr:Uncharacterized protein BP5553_05292 [Venustampulla echinocandica]RDL37859.1 Uncharacterized protein BP5553_05292 [Venustampulla echinocandica]
MIRGVWNQVSSTIGMASPLSERGDTALNTNAPLDASQKDGYEVTCYTTKTYVDNESDGLPSSPFVANIADPAGVENVSPSKMSRSKTRSPIERDPLSPLKPLKSRTSPTSKDESPRKLSDQMRSARKLSSPEKRFPVRPSMSPEKQPVAVERKLSIEVALAENDGLTKAIEILEDGDSENEERLTDGNLTFLGPGGPSPSCDEATNMDDSTFSTFSAIPDMTTFAKVGRSPTKYSDAGPTPRRNQVYTPATARRPMNNHSPSPTPRGHRFEQDRDDGNTTNLLDFTEQFNNFSSYSRQSPSKHSRQSPLKNTTIPDMPWGSTPALNRSNMSNLLDFDIPPAPTPRSMPSITPRELESLKSGFLSEISSLKASLSGKEAEVNSLKTAVGDAENRVGESLEQVREERSLKEQLAAEKEEWERRGREMEAVLRNVKDEILHGERDRDDLEGRLEESERRREAAEVMAQEAESKLAAVKTGKAPPTSEHSDTKPGECVCGGRAVEIAVEKVSRELHTLYKDKHETKVAALKKSYERRWEKKIKELESQIGDLAKENDELRQGRDATMTKVEPKDPHEVTEDLKKQAAKDAKSKELEAELEGLNQVVKSVKQDNSHLRRLLDEERVEKGKLVAAVDEMIPVVAAFDDMLAEMNAAPSNQQPSIPSQPLTQPGVVENLRGSISRASGLRAPTSVSTLASGESRIGRGGFGAPAGHNQERASRSGSAHGSRPGSGLGYRSGIMSSIERMGSHKGRGE